MKKEIRNTNRDKVLIIRWREVIDNIGYDTHTDVLRRNWIAMDIDYDERIVTVGRNDTVYDDCYDFDEIESIVVCSDYEKIVL